MLIGFAALPRKQAPDVVGPNQLLVVKGGFCSSIVTPDRP